MSSILSVERSNGNLITRIFFGETFPSWMKEDGEIVSRIILSRLASFLLLLLLVRSAWRCQFVDFVRISTSFNSNPLLNTLLYRFKYFQ